jgi:hypothetical protein
MLIADGATLPQDGRYWMWCHPRIYGAPTVVVASTNPLPSQAAAEAAIGLFEWRLMDIRAAAARVRQVKKGDAGTAGPT